MKILITGSSGQLGSYLVEALHKDHIVIGLDKKASKYTNIVGDIRDFNLVKNIVKHVDVIIHCAAQISEDFSVKNPLIDAEINIIGTLNLLLASKEVKLKKFIYISSSAVYGEAVYLPIDEKHPKNPKSPYGVSKLAGENYAIAFREIFKVPTICIRPFNIYSEREDPKSPTAGVISIFVHRVKNNKSPIIFGNGCQTRDFIHALDVVNMILLALNYEGDEIVFNCGTGKPTSINELARLIISLSGKNLEPIYTDERPGDIKHNYADIRKAQKILDFKPKISLREGIKRLMKVL